MRRAPPCARKRGTGDEANISNALTTMKVLMELHVEVGL